MRLKNQLVFAAEDFASEENLSRVQIPPLSIDMAEHPKLAHNVVDTVDRANRKTCVTLLRYTVDKPESSYAQVGISAELNEDEMFQQFAYVKYKLEKFNDLPNVKNSAFNNVFSH